MGIMHQEGVVIGCCCRGSITAKRVPYYLALKNGVCIANRTEQKLFLFAEVVSSRVGSVVSLTIYRTQKYCIATNETQQFSI